jgi:drug/metabolite transporter (DMT)-like permease
VSKKPARWKSYSFLLLNTLVWGLSFIAVKPALEFTTPFRYLMYRFILASLLCLPIIWFYLRQGHRVTVTQILKIAGIEVIGTIFCLGVLYLGLRQTTALEANLISSASPLFVTLGGIWILKEREEKHEWLGLALALSGTLLLIVLPLFQSMGGLRHVSVLGNLLILSSLIGNMVYIPLAKRYYAGIPKLFGTSIGFLVGAVSFSLISLTEMSGSLTQLWQIARIETQIPEVQTASIYMAVFGSIIGLTALIKGQDGIEVSEATLFGYLSPLVYLPLGYLILKEAPTPIQILGLSLTLVGVWIAEQRIRRRPRKSSKK